jgi:hypothetical protein
LNKIKIIENEYNKFKRKLHEEDAKKKIEEE